MRVAGRPARGPVRIMLGALALAALLLVPAAPADAHAVLLRTTPAAGVVLPQAPDTVQLAFNEPVRPVPADIRVVAPDGSRADRGRPAVSSSGGGSQLTLTLRDSLPKGTYLVSYRIISADSHPVGGGFSFSIGAPSKVAPAATGGSGATESGPVAIAVPVARYLSYAGLVLLIGPIPILLGLWPRRLSRRGPARLVWTGAGLVAVSTVAGFYLQAPYSLGAPMFGVSGSDVLDVLASRFGWASLVRLLLLAGAVPLLSLVTSDRTVRRDGEMGRPGRTILAVLAVVGLGTWGYGGHPGTSAVPALTVLADTAHLAGITIWLGGLLMLVAFLLPRCRRDELVAVLPVWSRWAGRAVGVLGLAGIVQAVLELGTPTALTGTTYGRLLIIKVTLFAVILAVATLSRSAVRRAVVRRAPAPVPVPAEKADAAGGEDFDDTVWDEVYGDTDTPAATSTGSVPPEAPEPPEPAESPEQRVRVDRRLLRRLVAVELLVAAVVLALTAALVQTTPARSAAKAAGQASQGYDATLSPPDHRYSLQVDLDPARTGSNTLHLVAYHASDGSPVKVLSWTATAALPAGHISPVTLNLQQISDNHVTAQFAAPQAGDWQLVFTLRVSDIDEDTVTATVPIR